MSLNIARTGGRPAVPAVPAVPGRVVSVTLPSARFPRDYQLKVTAGTQGSSRIKLHSMKFGSEAGSIHVTRADLLALADMVRRGEI